jgi:hypothetical protein
MNVTMYCPACARIVQPAAGTDRDESPLETRRCDSVRRIANGAMLLPVLMFWYEVNPHHSALAKLAALVEAG